MCRLDYSMEITVASIKDKDRQQGERLVTARELGAFLAASPSTVMRLVRDKQVPVVRVRGMLRFDLGAVLEALRRAQTLH